jgi:hypothetical protein
LINVNWFKKVLTVVNYNSGFCPLSSEGEGKGKVVPVLLAEHNAMKTYGGVEV